MEFSRNPTERFKTLPAVYMAIKMSQLKVSLELSVHSAEEIEGKVQGGTVSKLRNTRYCHRSVGLLPARRPGSGRLQRRAERDPAEEESSRRRGGPFQTWGRAWATALGDSVPREGGLPWLSATVDRTVIDH